MKEKQKELDEDKSDVKNLDESKPAPLLLQTVKSFEAAENRGSVT